LPIRSQMIEKCLYQRRIDLIQRQSFQHEAALVATEPEQQGEDIAVGLDGVCAQVALGSQMMREEVRDVHRKVGRLHGVTLRGMTSPKAALVRRVISG